MFNFSLTASAIFIFTAIHLSKAGEHYEEQSFHFVGKGMSSSTCKLYNYT